MLRLLKLLKDVLHCDVRLGTSPNISYLLALFLDLDLVVCDFRERNHRLDFNQHLIAICIWTHFHTVNIEVRIIRSHY